MMKLLPIIVMFFVSRISDEQGEPALCVVLRKSILLGPNEAIPLLFDALSIYTNLGAEEYDPFFSADILTISFTENGLYDRIFHGILNLTGCNPCLQCKSFKPNPTPNALQLRVRHEPSPPSIGSLFR